MTISRGKRWNPVTVRALLRILAHGSLKEATSALRGKICKIRWRNPWALYRGKTPGKVKSYLLSIHFRSKNSPVVKQPVLLFLFLGKMREQKRLMQQERAWSNQAAVKKARIGVANKLGMVFLQTTLSSGAFKNSQSIFLKQTIAAAMAKRSEIFRDGRDASLQV